VAAAALRPSLRTVLAVVTVGAHRWSRGFVATAFVLFLVVAQLYVGTGQAHAQMTLLQRAEMSRAWQAYGGKVIYGGKVFSRFLGPIGIGLGLWQGYEFGVSQGWWDDVLRNGTTEGPMVRSWTAHDASRQLWLQRLQGDGITTPNGQGSVYQVTGQYRQLGDASRCARVSAPGGVDPNLTIAGNGWISFGLPATIIANTDAAVLNQQTLIQGMACGTGSPQWNSTYLAWTPIETDGGTAPQQNWPGETTQRTTRSTVQCRNPAGQLETITATSTSYGRSDDPAPAPPVECPPGYGLHSVEVTSDPVNGSGESEVVLKWQQENTQLWDLYPDCMYVPGPGQECELRLVKRLTPTDPDSELQRCDEHSGNCQNWWTHSDRSLRFQCHWGPYVVPVEQCRELAYYYNPATAGLRVPAPQLLSPPSPNLNPNPTEVPPVPATAPLPGSSTITTPGGQTGTGTGTPPGTVTLPPPTPLPSDGDASCFSGMSIGWNPVSWVVEPGKCVLQWAFVPSPATMTAATQTMPQLFASKAPFSYLAEAGSWFAPLGALSGSGSCLLIQGNVAGSYLTVVDSCTPGAAEGWIMAQRAWLMIVVHGFILIPLAWWAFKAYAPASTGSA
jgi:hypothetical protein